MAEEVVLLSLWSVGALVCSWALLFMEEKQEKDSRMYHRLYIVGFTLGCAKEGKRRSVRGAAKLVGYVYKRHVRYVRRKQKLISL